jgi:hypothetical protein
VTKKHLVVNGCATAAASGGGDSRVRLASLFGSKLGQINHHKAVRYVVCLIIVKRYVFLEEYE